MLFFPQLPTNQLVAAALLVVAALHSAKETKKKNNLSRLLFDAVHVDAVDVDC